MNKAALKTLGGLFIGAGIITLLGKIAFPVKMNVVEEPKIVDDVFPNPVN